MDLMIGDANFFFSVILRRTVNYSEILNATKPTDFHWVPLAFRRIVDSSAAAAAAAAFGGTTFKEPHDLVSMLNSTRRSGRSIHNSTQIHDVTASGSVIAQRVTSTSRNMEIVSNSEVGEDILNIKQAQQSSHSRTMAKSQN